MVMIIEPASSGADRTKSVTLNGTNENLENTTTQSLGMANSFTISGWWKPDNVANRMSTWEIKQTMTDYSEEIFSALRGDQAGDPIDAGISNNAETTFQRYYYTAGYSAGSWIHVVQTWDGTTQKVYYNGSLASVATTLANSADSLTGIDRIIQLGVDNGSFWFSGSIGHHAIWNSVLSAAEVSAIYSGKFTINLLSDSGSYTSSANLQHYWMPGADTGTNLGKDYKGSIDLTRINVDDTNIAADAPA